MKATRMFAAALFLAALVSSNANAQAPAAAANRPAATPAAAAATTANGMTIALVYTDAFTDPKSGIANLISANSRLEREFQPRLTELQTMQTNLQKLVEDIQKTAPVADQATTARKQQQAEQMQVEFKRKQEDAQRAYEQRRSEVLAPISDNINTALQAFAKGRGIAILIDGSKAIGMIMPLANVDITNEFVADYNRKNPATAAATTPAAPAARRP